MNVKPKLLVEYDLLDLPLGVEGKLAIEGWQVKLLR